MHYRLLGRTGLKVSEVGLGCNRIGEERLSRSDWLRLIREATDAGVNLFDTSEYYVGGASEEILGEALDGNDEVHISTKVFSPGEKGFDGGFDRTGYLYGVIDRIFNLAAAAVARLSFFTRDWLDIAGVDGVVNGMADSAKDLGGALRAPQTGRVRTYILLAAGTATVVLLCILLS